MILFAECVSVYVIYEVIAIDDMIYKETRKGIHH